MSPAVFAECMAALSEQFSHPPMTEGRMKLYRRFLVDLDDAELQRAVATYLTEGGEFFPTIAALRVLARPLPTDVELAPIFRAIEGLERWSPEGSFVSAREVEAQCGAIAREAFVAAGGSSVFLQLGIGNNRVFAMQRFFAAFREAQQGGARNALLGSVGATVPLIASVARSMTMPAKPSTAQLQAAWREGKR